MLFMTSKSLLNRSLDPPGTLLINNRYLRMVPRAVVCIVVMCVPIVQNIDTSNFLGILIGLLQPLILWELVASMEKGWKWFEPKDS